jgi:hypothetical protein
MKVPFALTLRFSARLVRSAPRPAGKDTTCWYVGRFCHEILSCVIPPSGDWMIVSAHHWSPAEQSLSPG